MPFVICPKCGGKGIVNEHYDPLSGKFISEQCPHCEGGKIVTDFILSDIPSPLWE